MFEHKEGKKYILKIIFIILCSLKGGLTVKVR